MKRLITILIVLIISARVFAQAPSKMSYQAIVRGSTGELITTSTIGMRISILQGSSSGTIVYSETQLPVTNVNGLTTIEIGNGFLLSGNFSSINWANGPYFIKTETDPTGGVNYTIVGVSQLMSVPYALYAETSGTPGVQGLPGHDGLTTSVNNVQQINGNINLVKSDIGLGNVDNTSDVNKPVSIAAMTSLDLKANIASPVFTGIPTVPTAGQGSNSTQIASTAFVANTVIGSATPDADASTKGKVALGGDLAGTGSTAEAPVISDNAITTVKIADDNIITAKIADDNITTSKIADASITTIKISDDNITTSKIADANITSAKIADDNVTTSKIADANITSAKIADDNVTTSKIADAAVTFSKIQEVSSTDKVLGRISSGSGVIEEISTTGSGDVVRSMSPALTGTPTAPTANIFDNSTQLATTEFTKTAITSNEMKETPSGLYQVLSDAFAGKIVTTQWGGWPMFPDNLPNGFSCTIINYSNYPFTSNAISNAYFFTNVTGWNNGNGASSFGIKAGGTVRVNVIDVNGVKGYFVSGDFN